MGNDRKPILRMFSDLDIQRSYQEVLNYAQVAPALIRNDKDYVLMSAKTFNDLTAQAQKGGRDGE